MLYYIHGYQSSPSSIKGKLFKEMLNARPLEYRIGKPEDLVISDCLRRIAEEIREDKDVVLIGSSLGGFLAAEMALEHSTVKSLVLLNPLIIPLSEDANRALLEAIPNRILSEIRDHRLFDQEISADINILIGTMDKLIPSHWTLQFAMAQEATVKFIHDDHSLSRNRSSLVDIVDKIINARTQ